MMKKQAGVFEGPENLYGRIQPWVMNHFFSHTLQRAIEKYQVDPNDNLRRLILALNKKGIKPSKYRGSISTKFPIQLVVDWKYLTADEQKNALQILKAKKWPDLLKFVLIFKPWDCLGEFDDSGVIKVGANINVNSIDEFNEEYYEICDTLKHEIMHCGQKVLADIRNIPQSGIPSKKEKQFEKHDEDYYNKDDEFYPYLMGDIDYFNRQKFVSRKQQEDYYKKYIGMVGDNASPLFKNLMRQPEKWRKAIKELYKAIKWIETDEKNKKTSSS